MRQTWRGWWLRCHLYLGLSVGFLLALLGLTGSLLVFYLDVDAVANPHTRVQVTTRHEIDPDRVLTNLRTAFPQRDGPWRIEMPLHSEDPIRARYGRPAERSFAVFAPLLVTMDPHSLQVTSQRFWGDSGTTWLYDLHYSLRAGVRGQMWVGFLGVALAVSLCSGLVLWWPSKRRIVQAIRPVVRAGRVKRVYDLHVLSGVYGSAVLLVLSATGVALVWPQELRAMLSWVTRVQAPVSPQVFATPLEGAGISLQQAVWVARQNFPQAELRWLESSGGHGEVVSVRLFQPGEPGRRFPKTQIWLQPQTGDVIAVRDALNLPWSERLIHWMHPLHNGEALGVFGRVTALLAGLLLPVLWVTGLIRWRQKTQAQAVAKRALLR
jgi:uncharacterized iron-regulated membrane protein